MSSDPRVQKPRLPKSYTDEQLTFLRSHLPEFERRSQGSIRGDAKKFALERAADFIARFGLPEDFQGVEESESRFREVCASPGMVDTYFYQEVSKSTTGSRIQLGEREES